jgi:hypothetical protein
MSEDDQKRVRLTVHLCFALVFLVCVFVFRYIDHGSLIQTLLIVAGYTYGPLLALFAFGMFTKRSVKSEFVPVVCIAAPVACYVLKQNEAQWLHGYSIGTELLIINASLTFLLLILCSQKGGTITNTVITEDERTTDKTENARLDGDQSPLQLADI